MRKLKHFFSISSRAFGPRNSKNRPKKYNDPVRSLVSLPLSVTGSFTSFDLFDLLNVHSFISIAER